MATERFNIQSQTEHLQLRYVGTGHPDLTKMEWMLAQHRDSIASYIGHEHILCSFGVSQNQSVGRIRYKQLQKMVIPFNIPE